MNNLGTYTEKCKSHSAFGNSYIELMLSGLECTPLPVECSNPEHSWSVLKIGRKVYLECKQCNMLKLFFIDMV